MWMDLILLISDPSRIDNNSNNGFEVENRKKYGFCLVALESVSNDWKPTQQILPQKLVPIWMKTIYLTTKEAVP